MKLCRANENPVIYSGGFVYGARLLSFLTKVTYNWAMTQNERMLDLGLGILGSLNNVPPVS